MRKKILITFLILSGVVLSLHAYASRFDWTNGQPAVTEDITTNTGRYDWTSGQPTLVIQLAPPPATVVQDDNGAIDVFGNASVIISGNAQINF